MSYYHENTGKDALIREIHSIARAMGQHVVIEPEWDSTYEDLVDMKHEIIQDLIQTDKLLSRGIINARKIFKQN